MQFEYTTNRLIIKVLDYTYADKVLDFVFSNRDSFEPFESKKNSAFYTADYQAATLQAEYNAFLQCRYIRYYIFKKDDPHTIIGTLSASHIYRNPYFSCTIGYKIAPPFQRYGYATEALKCFCNAIFESLGMNRIEAYVMHNNLASMKLLDSLNFVNEGICHKCIKICDRFEDHYRFALIAEQPQIRLSHPLFS